MSRFASYLKTLSHVNGIGKAREVDWLFHCGMLFSSRKKWWGDFTSRHSAHEGIDITYYRRYPGKVKHFDSSIKIPAMDTGIILNICNDFLGRTLVVEQEDSKHFSGQILFVYAHILPAKNIKPGYIIQKKEIIARVCDTHKNPLLPPHLHFSCFEVPRPVPDRALDWKLFSKDQKINLINPVFL